MLAGHVISGSRNSNALESTKPNPTSNLEVARQRQLIRTKQNMDEVDAKKMVEEKRDESR
jgi:hypothetical protein